MNTGNKLALRVTLESVGLSRKDNNIIYSVLETIEYKARIQNTVSHTRSPRQSSLSLPVPRPFQCVSPRPRGVSRATEAPAGPDSGLPRGAPTCPGAPPDQRGPESPCCPGGQLGPRGLRCPYFQLDPVSRADLK